MAPCSQRATNIRVRQMETLKQDKWLGSHTKDAKMSLSLINGNVGLLAKADMEFEFTLGVYVCLCVVGWFVRWWAATLKPP